jgi:hypothetical protein
MFKKKEESGEQKKNMEEWLKKHNIVFDKVWTFGKPMADIFIDDRAISFQGNWQETVEAVSHFKVWNREEK